MTTETLLKTKPQMETITKGLIPYDVIIIGGGPAGLSAAIYACRAKLKTLLIEKAVLGGLASTTPIIENYPGFPKGISGIDLGLKMEEQAKALGVDILYDNVAKVNSDKSVEVDGKIFKTKALIVATGTSPKKLEVPGEKEFIGRGISYCATCDGYFYKDKDIVVVGGGNSAIEEAIFLTRFANKVTVIHRRDKLRADKILAEKAAANPKIYFLWSSIVEKIKGTNHVEEIARKDLTSGKTSIMKTDGVFIYVGSQPNSKFIQDLVKTDENGYILTDEAMKTNIEWIFAAGDIRKKSLRQVITAAADGAIAATSVDKYLEND